MKAKKYDESKSSINLTLNEVLALHLCGLSTTNILNHGCRQDCYPMLERADDILSRQKQLGIKSISCMDEAFPSALLALKEDCPPILHYIGNLSLINRQNMVAIIGARTADESGKEIAFDLGIRYSSAGVISGLARGIDTEAHWGCIDAEGATVAVVGTGLDRVHPKDNIRLQQSIIDSGGLIISEYPIGTKASPRTLIARTRLQAALAKIVIVVECEKESGTMHAVDFAIRYNRTIYAINNTWSGNRYLLDNNIAQPLPPEPEYIPLEEFEKMITAHIKRIFRNG